MERIAFELKIRPELKQEYKRAHDNIWPELKKSMQDAGIRNYSIYYCKNGTLFGYYEAVDIHKTNSMLEGTELAEKWNKYMKRFFIGQDNSKDDIEKEMLEEVFHMD